jgi:WD40 repeat protein
VNFRNANTDIEPVYTFRKHSGPVLSVLFSTEGDHCISSGLDAKIIVWSTPNFDTSDQYDPYGKFSYIRDMFDQDYNIIFHLF